MKIPHSIYKRLSLIKYFYQLGVEESNKISPKDSYSIIIFHDAIELFLGTTTTFFNVKTNKKMFFLDYINILNQDLRSKQNKQLKHTESMKSLNNARNSIKHEGLTFSKEEIERFKFETLSFFEENTQLIFSLEFEDISLIDLVKNKKVKEILIEVQKLKEGKEYLKALYKLRSAFRQLFDDFQSKTPNLSISRRRYHSVETSIEVDMNFEEIFRDLELIILNIDYKKYLKFRIWSLNYLQENLFSFFDKSKSRKHTSTHVDYCLNFVIECALKIQNFENEFNNIDML